MARLYGLVESPAAARVLAQMDAQGRKRDPRQRLDAAAAVMANQKNQRRIEQVKERLDEDSELKDMLRQIAQKGPDLRKAGI